MVTFMFSESVQKKTLLVKMLPLAIEKYLSRYVKKCMTKCLFYRSYVQLQIM